MFKAMRHWQPGYFNESVKTKDQDTIYGPKCNNCEIYLNLTICRLVTKKKVKRDQEER